MKVSIIIPLKNDNEDLRECIKECLKLDYHDFEILVLPDKEVNDFGDSKVKVIPTGDITPPKKRNLGMGLASGEILAFIDDDAYPLKDWLKKAIRHFHDESIVAVGGPAVTPKNDSLREKASGLVFSSFLGGGGYTYRYVPRGLREVDDFPSCNFIVRKSTIQELGGFKTNFWPGEDTALCLEITKQSGKKIIYDPEVFIYHHRRSLFIPHLKQVSRYALHRGYFAKRYPATSFRLSYFIPSFFVVALLAGGVLALVFPVLRPLYFSAIGVYLFLVFVFSIKNKLSLIPLVFLGTILTHLCYGLYFIKGIVSRKLKEEK